MAHSEVPAEKIEAYRKTAYWFGRGPDVVTLRIEKRCAALARLYTSSGYASGAFITAYNPFGQHRSRDANEAAHARLGVELAEVASTVIEGAGVDPAGGWPEEKSFFGLGVDLECASKLGIRFQQDAIVWAGEDAVPRLILLR